MESLLSSFHSRAFPRALAAAIGLGTGLAGRAPADTVGFSLPGTCVSSPGGTGAAVWQNPGNAQSSTDGQARAATGALAAPAVSQHLKCTNFGFSVPHGSVIDGIVMDTSHRRSSSGQIIADAAVYPVRSDDAPIGSVGLNRARPCDPPAFANDWTTSFNTVTYADPAAPTWGIPWGACAAGSQTCTDPPGSYNVNHPGFGVAIAAQACQGSGAAWVDYARVQVSYTVPACGGAAWAPPTVVPSDRTPGAAADYLIGTRVPNAAGCALTTGSVVTVTFPPDTDPGTMTSVTLNGAAVANPSVSGRTLTFGVPAGALAPCGTQTCLHKDQVIVIAVNGVTNPSTDGDYTLTLAAAPTLNGATGTTTSDPYMISAPCVPGGASASQWGPITVTLVDAGQSLPDCPKFTSYTIASTVPSPGGCRLIAGGSEIVVTFPASPAGSNVTRVTSATVNGTAVTPDTSGGPLIVRLRPPMDVGNGQPLTIGLGVVRNPDATSPAPTLTLRATNTRNGSTAETSSAPYAITAAAACTPILDFYVRDWTTDAATHDVGDSPSAGGVNWAATSDVWNQLTSTNPTLPADDWVRGTNPTKGATNFAFARISLKTANAPPALDRRVRARFYLAPFGASPSFGLLGETSVDLASNAPPTFVNVPWPTAPDPFAGITNGTHACLAVEIASPSDPLTSLTLLNTTPDWASKNAIEADNNQAQRNLTFVVPPAPPSPLPLWPVGGLGGGEMAHFAMIHNGTSRTRDVVLRFDTDRETLRHFRDPRVAVVRGDAVRYEPGGTIVLPQMRPAEDRWIAFSYSLVPGAEGALLPIGFSQMHEETRVSGFAFGIRPSPLRDVIPENLRIHRDVFERLGRSGVAAARSTGAAAEKLLAEPGASEERYLAFLRGERRSIRAATAPLLKDERLAGPVQLPGSLDRLDERAAAGDAFGAATAHLALLERLDAFQNIRQIERGNPLDIPQMVRWQHDLFSTLPPLRDASKGIVERSQAFLEAVGRRDPHASYQRLLADSMKAFHAAAAAARAAGIDAGPALDRLQQASKADQAALQQAHEDYLLQLDRLRAPRTPGEQEKEP